MISVKKVIQKTVHSWDLKLEEAIALQTKLSRQVVYKSLIPPGDMRTVAGIDTGYRNNIAHAAVVVLDTTSMKIVETAVTAKPVRYPYVPGLLAFREGPVILEALAKLKTPPHLLMMDGQGIAHPRRFGIASHIGLLIDIPAIGCAKTKLVGDYEAPQLFKGSFSYLTDREEIIGAVVRTRTGVKPVFVSSGHLMDLNDSIRMVLKFCCGYRLPEPLRRADHLSRKKLTSV